MSVVTRLQKSRLFRFVLAGVANTVFGFVVYSLMIWWGTRAWLAIFAGMLAGTIFNFFTTGGYAFRELSLKKFPKFMLYYFFVFGVNVGLVESLDTLVPNKIVLQALITPLLAVMSYILLRRFIFNADSPQAEASSDRP